MRVPFASLFSADQNGITALVRVRIGGVTLEPGTSLVKGTNVGGIDLTNYVGRTLEADFVDGVWVIKAIYSS